MTPRQADIYNFVKAFWAEHGCAPSYRQIAAGCKVASGSHVHRIIRTLHERGMVWFLPGKARTIRALEFDPPRPEVQ